MNLNESVENGVEFLDLSIHPSFHPFPRGPMSTMLGLLAEALLFTERATSSLISLSTAHFSETLCLLTGLYPPLPHSQLGEPQMELDGPQSQLVGLWASWEALRVSWEDLGASWEGLGASWEDFEASWESLRERDIFYGPPDNARFFSFFQCPGAPSWFQGPLS